MQHFGFVPNQETAMNRIMQAASPEGARFVARCVSGGIASPNEFFEPRMGRHKPYSHRPRVQRDVVQEMINQRTARARP